VSGTGPGPRRPPEDRTRGGLGYWPHGPSFLLALLGLLVVTFVVVEVGVVTFAYERLGVPEDVAALVLLASIAGSFVNVVVARLPARVVRGDVVVTVLGVPYVVPAVVRTDEVVVAVNVGGALVPSAMSAYLMFHDDLGMRAVVAVACVALATKVCARAVRGVGIVVPTLVPPVAAIAAALLLGGGGRAAVAFVGGTLGTLIGGDLLNLRRVRGLGAPVASIGGAGTFDGIFVTGVLAVLFASL